MVNVNHNTWWIHSSSTIYVCNTLQGMENLRRTVESEQYIYSGGKMSSHMEVTGTYSLILNNGFILCLENTFYVPSFSKNLYQDLHHWVFPLIFGFCFFFNKYKIIGSGALLDGLYSIEL